MEDVQYLVARDLDELSLMMHLVPRSGSCVKCDDTTELQCPKCSDGTVCQFTVPVDCTQCAKSICVADDSSSTKSSGGGPSIGGIVGGVVGGLVVIAIATYLVWKYCIKPKRSEMSQTVYDQDSTTIQGSEKVDSASRGTRPPSTHTVHSIASTVLTRASNIIQIAYIPGVTNRATPTDPNVLVPPVPPIPVQHTEGRTAAGDDQHFFVPGDLRDSTYSGLSGYTDRTSYARTSYAPRSSVASTIYGKQAQVLTPAQTGMRAKPTMVSVKSGSQGLDAPPVPTIDFGRFGANRPKSGMSAFSIGSTFLSSANTATQTRAQVVKVSGLKKIDIAPKSESDSSSTSVTNEASRPTTPSRNPTRDSSATTIIDDSPAVDQGPFSDPPERTTPRKSSTPGLNAVIEDSAGENKATTDAPAAVQRRDSSPFGDQHATKE